MFDANSATKYWGTFASQGEVITLVPTIERHLGRGCDRHEHPASLAGDDHRFAVGGRCPEMLAANTETLLSGHHDLFAAKGHVYEADVL